jgi:hypothetical protein
MYKIYLLSILLIMNCLALKAQVQISNFSKMNVSCTAASDGAFMWKLNGGTAPYSIAPFGITTTLSNISATNLSAGTYTIIATDANNVSTSTVATITVSNTVTKILVSKSPVCFGDTVLLAPLYSQNNATIAANYCFPAFTNSNNEDITNFSFGSINNTTSCSAIGNYTSITNKYNNYLNIANTIHANDVIPFNITVSNCNGGVGSSNISSIYIDYNADGDFNDANEQVYVSPNNYTGAHTETGVITVPYNIEKGITRLRVINATATAGTINNCGNYANGEAEDYTIFLQQAPISIYWTSNAILSLDTALAYTPSATDTVKLELNYNNGCYDTALVPIQMFPAPSVNITAVSATCPNAALLAVVYNGTSPVIFNWLPTFENTQSITNLNNGLYICIITDSNNCKASTTYSVTLSPTLLSTPIVTNVKCFGQTNGAINVNITGGVPPYNYLWTPSYPNSPTINSLAGASYAVTITDINNCSITKSIVVTTPSAPLQVQMNSVNASAAGVNDGQANALASGGTPIYTYLWSPGGQTTNTITNLAGGSYQVQVVDANGCSETGSVIVSQPNAISDLQKEYGLNIYPNPTNNKINIDSKKQINQLQITTLTGQVIYTQQINKPGLITVDCTSFSNGTYMLTCNTELSIAIQIQH